MRLEKNTRSQTLELTQIPESEQQTGIWDWKTAVIGIGVLAAIAAPSALGIAWIRSETCWSLGPDATLWDRFSGKSVAATVTSIAVSYSFLGQTLRGCQKIRYAKTMDEFQEGINQAGIGAIGTFLTLFSAHQILNRTPILQGNTIKPTVRCQVGI